MFKTKEEYTAKMKEQLDALNADIDVLEAKASEAKEELRQKYREELAKLREQSKLTMSKFDELKLAGEASWDHMVAEMDNVRNAFVHSFHYFKSQV